MRITKFDTDKANDTLISIQQKIGEVENFLANMVDYTIRWYENLKTKYGAQFPRRTEIRNFETIVAAKVVEANEKLYVNYEEGFIGTSLRKDEFVCNCSDIDDIIVFFKDGKYKIVKVADKLFVGKNILYLNVFKKNDKRTVYNAVYRDGKAGAYYIKRFAVSGITRDKEYDITQEKPNSKVIYFTVNPNAEAEIIRVTLKPKPRLSKLVFEKDFSEIAIKGRQSMGNILTKNEVHKIQLKHKGGSTLGGREVWFDRDVLRLNYDSRGEYLGEFQSEDLILVASTKGDYYTTTFDLTNHFEKDILVIEKFDAQKVWTLALYDADQKYHYLKRFQLDTSQRMQNFLGENSQSQLILMSDVDYPRFEIVFGGADTYRETLIVDADEFIGVKGFKAKGKRLTTFEIESINELEPLRHKKKEETSSNESDTENDDDENVKNTENEESVEKEENERVVEVVERVEKEEVKNEEKSKNVEKEKNDKNINIKKNRFEPPIDDENIEENDIEEAEKAIADQLQEKKSKTPAKTKSKTVQEEVIDQKTAKDEITGQMSLF
jgi:hypothetical protein